MRKKVNIYTVIKACGDEIYTTNFATRDEAIKNIEERSGQNQSEWAFDTGTVYEGDSNYETRLWYEEDEMEVEVDNA